MKHPLLMTCLCAAFGVSVLTMAHAESPSASAGLRTGKTVSHGQSVSLSTTLSSHAPHGIVHEGSSCGCTDAACCTHDSCGDCGPACLDHKFCPHRAPGTLHPHTPYAAEPRLYYYFRPYNWYHIPKHQESVISYGGDPRHPYANYEFRSIYEGLE